MNNIQLNDIEKDIIYRLIDEKIKHLKYGMTINPNRILKKLYEDEKNELVQLIEKFK